MRFSTTFKFNSAKSLIEKIKDAIRPKDAETFSVNVELSCDISADELAELYREYRSEVDAASSDVSSFLDQMKKVWVALKNGFNDLLMEILNTEDLVNDVQDAVNRLRKNARENESNYRIYSMKLAKEEKDAEEEINKEKTED